MRHWGLCCVLAGCLAGMTGCGWLGTPSSSSSGGLAVVDLDRVATAVGVNTQLAEMVQFRQATLNNAVVKLSNEQNEKLQSLLDEIKDKFGEEVPKEEAQKLRKEALVANSNMQQARTNAQANLNQYTEELKMQFREKVRPIAQEVAVRKGFSIVIPKNDGLLLSVEPGNDITNDVIKALQANNGKTAAAKPAAEETTSKPEKKKSPEKKTAAAPREKPAPKEIDEK